MKFSFVLAFFSIISFVNSYKILGIFPLPSASHYAIGESTMKTLAEAGHEVTMISPMKTKVPMKNFREIVTQNAMKEALGEDKFNAFNFAKDMPLLFNELFIFQMTKIMIEGITADKEIQKMMKTESFDAVVVELFGLDALIGFGQHFNCSVIGVTTFDGVYWNDVYTSNQSPYSYVPMIFAGLPDQMTFVQRLQNTVLSVAEKLLFNFYHLPRQKKLYENLFPEAKFSFDEVHKNISVVFMNSHVSSGSARPFLPNMIEIGGIHIQPAKKLPQDIQDFLDSATDGAILFSMGSFVQSTDWTPQQRESFLKVFGKLKQKVLWKYENETLPGNPGNIKIGKWLPQRDIVAHPNVKLFITHGGQCGTTEALNEGVPLLGIPLFGDQGMNIKRAVHKGTHYPWTLRILTKKTSVMLLTNF